MTRNPLKPRRESRTCEVEHREIRFTVTVGFDLEWQSKEVFADGAKSGSDMAATISDSCVVISMALQFGATPAQIGKSLGRVPDPMAGKDASRAASSIGVIIDAIISTQESIGCDAAFNAGAGI